MRSSESPMATAPPKLNLLPLDSRIISLEFSEIVKNGEAHMLVDARPGHQFKIVSLPKALNILLLALGNLVAEICSALTEMEEHEGKHVNLHVICRRGNDSQRAIQYLQNVGFTHAKDIVGGIEGWTHYVDPNFPTY